MSHVSNYRSFFFFETFFPNQSPKLQPFHRNNKSQLPGRITSIPLIQPAFQTYQPHSLLLSPLFPPHSVIPSPPAIRPAIPPNAPPPIPPKNHVLLPRAPNHPPPLPQHSLLRRLHRLLVPAAPSFRPRVARRCRAVHFACASGAMPAVLLPFVDDNAGVLGGPGGGG